MTGTRPENAPESDQPGAPVPGDSLSRAVAAGPMHWDDDANGESGDSANLEAGEAHDSPAAIDEERAGQESVGDPDPLRSIYRAPFGHRSQDGE